MWKGVFCIGSWLALTGVMAMPAAAIDFNRDVRPILSNNCFRCHGPDAAKRKAGLRLDAREHALKPTESGATAIVPGKPDESEIVRRVFDTGDEQMPPADSNKRLTETEKARLREWIAAGAPWQEHWAFIAATRPSVPSALADGTPPARGYPVPATLQRSDWPRNAIDNFILARLEAEKLTPSPEADRLTLIRRLSLDLTGLPPTPDDVDRFVNDTDGDAYDTLVDRLLNSPRYGERMAQEWLDAARFADTHGYHIDAGRDMSRWRDWVIASYNRNQPFDQFTIEQLAGDLLPNPTVDQLIASGFNRNHMINFEGGAIPEEYHTAYIVDRVNTTSTVWLGLTVACAQCHDHKYDPLTQKEFYQLYAFFNNVPENGLDGRNGNAEPMVKAPSREERRESERLSRAIAAVERELDAPMAQLDEAQLAWEKEALERSKLNWTILDLAEFRSAGGATLTKLDDKSILAGGENPTHERYTLVAPITLPEITAVRLEALPDDSLVAKGPGRSANGNIVLTGVSVSVTEASSQPRAVPIKAVSADYSQPKYSIELAIDDKPDTGWGIHPQIGKPHHAVFEAAEPIRGGESTRLTVTLAFESEFGQHQLGRFRLSTTTSLDPHGKGTVPAEVHDALAVSMESRHDAQRSSLRKYFRQHVSEGLKPRFDELARLRDRQAALDKAVPTVMVMREMPTPRDTFLLIRGQYDKHGEKVSAGVPACLPPLADDAAANRLGLARWLVDPAHPLTARVIVNRYWQMLFGTGLVKTAEDFGSQGERPSHPELLDWLAVEFRESGWDVKHMLRLMVTSATYRQSSATASELLAKDPENRLLARMSRLRLPAEAIRDQALAASGLLDGRIGGPSVSPYQPPGLWEELMSREDGKNWTAQVYVQSHGADLYRRTMYTFWKRTSPPPTLSTFDAPDREVCTVRRARTNTPLQALILMNDPTYIEAARKLAERVLGEAGTTDDGSALAFRLVLARPPSDRERAVVRRVVDEQLAKFRSDAEAAKNLLVVGESLRDERYEPAEVATWTTVASMIFNLDEAVTRN
jgi:mono/diheme cytochrome c family protein